MTRDKLVIFGGAFDPPTMAHYFIMCYLQAQPDIQEIVVIPSFRHVYGKEMSPFGRRVGWLDSIKPRTTHSGLPHVVVSELEKWLSERPEGFSGLSCDLVEWIAQQDGFPKDKLLFVIGADNAKEIEDRMWEGSDKLLSLCNLVVMGRGNYTSATFSHHPWYDRGADVSRTSSTHVRGCAKSNDLLGVQTLVHPGIVDSVMEQWGGRSE